MSEMEGAEILKELETLFQEVLKRGSVSLKRESTVNDVDGWDSLTNMLLISAIEKKYSVHFKFREIMKFRNVGDLCDSILLKSK